MNIHLIDILLNKLNVPHTKYFLKETAQSMPFGDSMWALCKLLNIYNIYSRPYRICSLNDIVKVHFPFVTVENGQFLIIDRCGENELVITNEAGKVKQRTIEDFVKSWTGIVLEVFPNTDSCEIDFKLHLKKQRLLKLSFILTLICTNVIFSFMVVNAFASQQIDVPFSLFMLVLNVMGICISIFLVKMHLGISDKTAESICHIIKNSNCERDKHFYNKGFIFQGIEPSAVSLGYFSVNCIFVLEGDKFVMALALYAIISILAVSWSIYSQITIVKSWCPLCLLVDFFLLVLAFSYAVHLFLMHSFCLTYSDIFNLVLLACSYMLSFFVLNFLMSNYIKRQENIKTILRLNQLKYDKNSWDVILKNRRRYNFVDALPIQVSVADTQQKPEVIIIGNPYCNPCANLHKKLSALRAARYSIYYIFTSFNDELSNANEYITGKCLGKDAKFAWNIITKWYESPVKSSRVINFYKDDPNMFIKSNALKIRNIVKRQRAWVADNGIGFTPTILINGYQMPSNYKIEDLLFLY